jgi:FMN phosphatase YigB (HAD superfamily)
MFQTTQAMKQSRIKPRAIVFDFGGVIIDWKPRYLYRRFFDGDHHAMEEYLPNFRPPRSWRPSCGNWA